ncbi:MAG: hypothetical protein QXX91_02840 [Thermoplasmata archaeon]|nr:hypothetical protein [Staphylococcus epidermidis]
MNLFKIILISILNSFIVSLFFFSFYFPNISFPPIGDLLMNFSFLFLIFSIAIGTITAFYLDELSEAFIAILITMFISYGISLVYYSFPIFYGLYPFDITYYFFIYIKFTFLPFFAVFFGLIIGLIPGGFLADLYYARSRKIY